MNPIVKSLYFDWRQTLLHRLGPALRPTICRPVRSSAEIKKILFIRIDRIGDMVLSTPAIRALKSLFPKAELTVLASPSNHVLLRHAPEVDDIVVCDLGSAQGVRKSIRLIQFLRNSRFDVVVDPMISHDLQTSLLVSATKAPIRVGFPGAGREVFYNRLASNHPNRHFVELTLDLVRELGAADVPAVPSIVMAKKEMDFGREWLRSMNPQNRTAVGIHPGGYYASQRWPAKNFIAFARGLQKKCNCRVVLLGGASEQSLLREIAGALHEPPAVFQAGDLRKAAAVTAQLPVMVCNNSGPLHLAAALGVPTVSFMGPTRATRWWPVGSGHCVLRLDHLPCLGCEEGVCPKGSLECLQQIHPDRALGAVERILQKSHR